MSGDEISDIAVVELVGPRLIKARDAMGLSRADVVARTRIQERYIRAIEESDYPALPARTYALGFARTYADKVGLDPNEIVRDLRDELAEREPQPAEHVMPAFTPGDPARVPSARFAALATAAAVVVAGGAYLLWHTFYLPDADLPSLVTDTPAPQVAPPQRPAAAPMPSVAATAGPVVFTSLDSGVWVKFYDAAGKTLLNKQMAAGETYTVPADANGPMVWTGRPEALAVSIGGKPAAKLSDTRQTVHDMPVSAAALLARAVPVGVQAPASTAAATSTAQAGGAAGAGVHAAPGAAPNMASMPMAASTPSSHPVHHYHTHATASGAAAAGAGDAASGATAAGTASASSKASTVSE